MLKKQLQIVFFYVGCFKICCFSLFKTLIVTYLSTLFSFSRLRTSSKQSMATTYFGFVSNMLRKLSSTAALLCLGIRRMLFFTFLIRYGLSSKAIQNVTRTK